MLLTLITNVLIIINLLAFMDIFPLFITSPLLFIAIFTTLYFINHRKTFKGF
ncbi:hypothetical protein [Metabacillus halosaccharovorans]|uniref:hypothetical protein n=1 Tax=Metabacillus halosaccharovorans TaxID=930124 RepID=UPI00203EA61E|nr:hypothetical protein [Metabacillus halosaccharovorans]MCM3442380.1 hypothetical protein [Metabacillus halosaccharovorans]